MPPTGRTPNVVPTPVKREKPEIVVMREQLELKARQLFVDPIDGRITHGPTDAIRELKNLQRQLETGTMDIRSIKRALPVMTAPTEVPLLCPNSPGAHIQGINSLSC